MKLFIVVISLFSISLSVNAQTKKSKPDHRHHEAHVHGSATLAIAFDEGKGRIEFKGAAEGILGFEHKPKNKKDQKVVDDAIAKFESDIAKMVQFDSSLNCQFTKDMIGQVAEAGEDASSGEHSDWAANFNVSCAKPLAGTNIKVDFSNFKLIKDIDITVLAGAIQKSAEFKKKPVVIELK